MLHDHRQLRLAPGVHAAAVGDDLVFLDVAADAYLCLPGAAAGLACGAGSRLIGPFAPEAAAALTHAGLAGPHEGGAEPRAPPLRPARDIADAPAQGRWLELLSDVLRLLLDAATKYQGKPLRRLLEQAAEGRAPHEPVLSGTLTAAVRRYRRAALYAPLPRKCLLQSFLLLLHLRRAGCDAQWVFAVRTWPFGAHCWLQVEDVVLDDHHERLAAYEPIMTV